MNDKFQFVKGYLESLRLFLISYLLIVTLMFLTFQFEGLTLTVFWDFTLLSLAIVLLFIVINFYITYNKQQQFLHFNKNEQNAKLPDKTAIEHAYRQIVKELQNENRQLRSENRQNAADMLSKIELWTHQMKVPLAAIKLMGDTGDTKDLKVEVDELTHYLDLVLNIMRLNQTSTDYQFETVELSEIVKQSIKKYARFFIAKDLRIELENFSKKIVTDKKWLRFAFEQVLYNAVKYTNHGQIKIDFRDNVLVVVDSGIGISSQDLPRIFEAGYTGYNGHMTEKSSGLGLSQAKLVLENLGMTISIDSEVGVGTTVKLKLKNQQSQVER